jgi:uncharacterized membrane protein
MDNKIKDFAIVSFLVLFFDLIWIQLVMKERYTKMIPQIQKSPMRVRYFPAFLSYMTIIIPVFFFSLPNIRKETRLRDALFYGGFLGACMYGMFSFTNYALIDNWDTTVVFLDTLWGGILYTLVSYIASFYI